MNYPTLFHNLTFLFLEENVEEGSAFEILTKLSKGGWGLGKERYYLSSRPTNAQSHQQKRMKPAVSPIAQLLTDPAVYGASVSSSKKSKQQEIQGMLYQFFYTPKYVILI